MPLIHDSLLNIGTQESISNQKMLVKSRKAMRPLLAILFSDKAGADEEFEGVSEHGGDGMGRTDIADLSLLDGPDDGQRVFIRFDQGIGFSELPDVVRVGGTDEGFSGLTAEFDGFFIEIEQSIPVLAEFYGVKNIGKIIDFRAKGFGTREKGVGGDDKIILPFPFF
jgi:hypothetical protein